MPVINIDANTFAAPTPSITALENQVKALRLEYLDERDPVIREVKWQRWREFRRNKAFLDMPVQVKEPCRVNLLLAVGDDGTAMPHVVHHLKSHS